MGLGEQVMHQPRTLRTLDSEKNNVVVLFFQKF